MWSVAVVCILRDVHRRGLNCVVCGSGLYPEGRGTHGWPWTHCKGPVNSDTYQTGQGHVVGCCGCSSETLSYIKYGNLLATVAEELSACQ